MGALLGVRPAQMQRFFYSEIPEDKRRRAEHLFLEVRCKLEGTVEGVYRRERHLPYDDFTAVWHEVELRDDDGRLFVFRLSKAMRRLANSPSGLTGGRFSLVGTIKVDGRQRFPASLFTLKRPSNVERLVPIQSAWSRVLGDEPAPEMTRAEEPVDAIKELATTSKHFELDRLAQHG